jgi:high-affinity iron transporter
MLGSAIIVFREVIEAGLIVGITAAATRGIASRGLWIGAGVAGGVLGACLVAAFIQTLAAAFEGIGQELFNAAILSVAVVMLAWHNIWMAHHGRELAAQMKGVGQAVAAGTTSLMALALVVGVAVLREGSEIALFLYGIAAGAEPGSAAPMALGGAIGLALGILIGLGTYVGLVRVPARYLFGVTSALLAFLAAGMAAQAVAFLQQADQIRIFGATLWDTSGLLSDKSVLGRVLHTLVGYNDHPTAMEAVAYAMTLLVIAVLTRAQAGPVQRRATV